MSDYIANFGFPHYQTENQNTAIEKFTFVCYAHRDAEYVAKIAHALYDKGIHLWYDEGIPEGFDWRSHIVDAAIKKSSAMLVFISKSLVSSDYCYAEVAAAQTNGIVRIPIMIEETEIPSNLSYALSTIEYINKNLNKSISEIVDTLYVSIGNAYHGNKSDISLTLKQMSDNVDAYLKAGDWNMAMEEAQRCQKTDASSFWGWWCILKVLTNGQAKVECYGENPNYSVEEEAIREIEKCYQLSITYAPDKYKNVISNYYLNYRNNLNMLYQFIELLKQNYQMYTYSLNDLFNHLRKHEVLLQPTISKIVTLLVLIITWLVSLLFTFIIINNINSFLEEASLYLLSLPFLCVFSVIGLPLIIYQLINIIIVSHNRKKNIDLANAIRKKIDEVEKYNYNYVCEIEAKIEELITTPRYVMYQK